MRIALDYQDKSLLRCWTSAGEVAWLKAAVRGLRLDVEFPSDWHERRRVWIRISLGLISGGFSFPWWGRVVPDDGQCSGPTYGFYFFGDSLVLQWGKTTSHPGGPIKHIQMPWGWRFRRKWTEGTANTYSYRYERESGEIQERKATIIVERREWLRPWIPWRMTRRTIAVTFNDEVGERTGSWKGGVLGCGYDMQPGETKLECLRRMERERRFH